MLLDFYRRKEVTNTTLFLVPLIPLILNLNIGKSSFLSFISKNGFITSFIDDFINCDGIYENCIFLFFDKSKILTSKTRFQLADSEEQLSLEEYLLSKKECLDSYEYEDYLIFVISAEKIKLDFKKIVSGKYSLVSKETKTFIEKSMNKDNIYKYIHAVLNKNDSLRDLLIKELNTDSFEENHSVFGDEDIYMGEELTPYNYLKLNNLFKNIKFNEKT